MLSSVVFAPISAAVLNTAAPASTGFPFGFIIGGVMVVIGLVGGIYGQMIRRRGRRPPR